MEKEVLLSSVRPCGSWGVAGGGCSPFLCPLVQEEGPSSCEHRRLVLIRKQKLFGGSKVRGTLVFLSEQFYLSCAVR